MIFRSIVDSSEVDLLVSRSMNTSASARWVAGVLQRRQSRPAWCRMALSEAGEVLAAHAMDSWSPDADPGDVPTFVQLLGRVLRIFSGATGWWQPGARWSGSRPLSWRSGWPGRGTA